MLKQVVEAYTKQYIGKFFEEFPEEMNFNPNEYDVYKYAVKFTDNSTGFAYKIVDRFHDDKHQGLIDAEWLFECPHIDIDPFGHNYFHEKESKVSDMLMTVFELKELYTKYKNLEYIIDHYPLTQTQKEKDEFIKCGSMLMSLGMAQLIRK